MPVIINFKICDNAEECGGVAVCPTGALSWDDKGKTLVIDNEKCTSCGLCESECMVGAISVAKNDGEYEEMKAEIEADLRKATDLFVDRYGAAPIGPTFLVKDFDLEVLQSAKPVVVELFNGDSIMCLLASTPISELLDGHDDVKYKKMEVEGESLLKQYGLSELPALLFFKDGKMLGKIEGYFGNEQKEEMKGKIEKILS